MGHPRGRQNTLEEAESDNVSLLSSAMSTTSGLTTSTLSTFTGLGTDTGKFIMFVGGLVVRGIEGVMIRRRLTAIETAFNKNGRPGPITDEDVNTLIEFQRLDLYPADVRRRAIGLILCAATSEEHQLTRILDCLLRVPRVELKYFLQQLMAFQGKKSVIFSASSRAKPNLDRSTVLQTLLDREPQVVHDVFDVNTFMLLLAGVAKPPKRISGRTCLLLCLKKMTGSPDSEEIDSLLLLFLETGSPADLTLFANNAVGLLYLAARNSERPNSDPVDWDSIGACLSIFHQLISKGEHFSRPFVDVGAIDTIIEIAQRRAAIPVERELCYDILEVLNPGFSRQDFISSPHFQHAHLLPTSIRAELAVWGAALKAYDEADYDTALEKFSTIADSSRILFNIGLIYATIGEHETAVEQFATATSLDQYLAIAHFQCGVSNFLLGNFEVAYKDFDDALLYLRGNKDINYEQLGLKFTLYRAEVLFNRGLSFIRMGKLKDGLAIMEQARGESASERHDVIDEAIAAQAQDYLPFSIPVGVLFRPDEGKLKGAKTRNSLDKMLVLVLNEPGQNLEGSTSSDDYLGSSLSDGEGHSTTSELQSESSRSMKIRIKLNYQGNPRGMSIDDTTPFEAFTNRLTEKLSTGANNVRLTFTDEDGDKIRLRDESDYELAIEAARANASGRPEGRLEIWCAEI